MKLDIDLSKGCPDCGSQGFHPGPRGGASINVMCAMCGYCFNSSRIGAHRIGFVPGVYRTTIVCPIATLHSMIEQITANVEAMLRRSGPILAFEGRVGSNWQVLGIQLFGGPPATISHNHDGIRDIYLTQVFEDRATISRMPFGVDIETGAFREIDAVAVENATLLHSLAPGQTVELELRPDRATATRHVRYRYEAKLCPSK